MEKLTRNELSKLTLEQLEIKLKNARSTKCTRGKKYGEESDQYLEAMRYCDLIVKVKASLMNKPKTYYEFSEAEIEALTLPQLERFIKGIASKKCLCPHSDKETYARCEELIAFANKVKKTKNLEQEELVVTKTELRTLLEHYELNKDVELLIRSLEELTY